MKYKKITLTVFTFIVFVQFLGLVISCRKKAEEAIGTCSIKNVDIATATTAYSNSKTKANCTAVVAAYQSYLNAGCDTTGSTANELSAFQQQTNNCN